MKNLPHETGQARALPDQCPGPDIAPSDASAAVSDRRRPGRVEAVSPTLLPLLRGEADPAPERRSCAACRKPGAVPALTMAFQPIVDLQEQRIDSYEALVRGTGGEGAGEMLKWATGENLYAFDQACRVKAIELASGLNIDRNLNINFLPNAVYEPRACIRATLEAAARTRFDTRRLTFEIVETESISDTAHLLNIITEYRKMGFRVALDDFGSGYSGLTRLADLRPDTIKIDRSLAQDCDRNQVRLAILASVLGMAREIGIKVVVEGVERIGEVEALRGAGARFIQGFYFARPEFERLASDSDIDWGRAA